MDEHINYLKELSQTGRQISAAMSVEKIIQAAYENIQTMMDAAIFTIGLHRPELNVLEFAVIIENGQLLPPFTVPLSDENQVATWCFKRQEEVVLNNNDSGSTEYPASTPLTKTAGNPCSVMCLPMWQKEKAIGVITVQSYNKNAFSEVDLNILRNLSNYCAMAIRNADAHWRLEGLLDELQAAHDKLIIQSKLAGLGEITAGIAHEIQNPLNFVNNFSELSNELLDEMRQDLINGEISKADEIFVDIKQNLEKICEQGKRADSIVKGMLQHSRSAPGQKEPTDINALADEFLRLAYHGLRAKDKSFNTTWKTDFDDSIGKINVVSQDIGRVILNLLTNAFYAVNEKRKLDIPGYSPLVTVYTKKLPGKVEIRITDNGNGIPPDVLDKIFQPFFSTKPSGEGTGLGLTLSNDIITKGHGGELKVKTKEGEGSSFYIFLQDFLGESGHQA
jgi:signal transduction histidine kinase